MNILGLNISVKLKNLKSVFGEFKGDSRCIEIDKSQSIDEQVSTLFHEMIHAALFVSGHSEMLKLKHEEAIIRALEHGLIEYVDKNKLKRILKNASK